MASIIIWTEVRSEPQTHCRGVEGTARNSIVTVPSSVLVPSAYMDVAT